MRRQKQKQHVRHYRSGKKVLVNKGVKKKKLIKRRMALPGKKAPFTRDEHFANKALRDERFKELKAMGEDVRKASSSNDLLDPRYVEDSGATEDFGLNNDYRRRWPKLYSIRKGF